MIVVYYLISRLTSPLRWGENSISTEKIKNASKLFPPTFKKQLNMAEGHVSGTNSNESVPRMSKTISMSKDKMVAIPIPVSKTWSPALNFVTELYEIVWYPLS